jgi:hypothetical protein
MTLKINGKNPQPVPFMSTGDWSNWQNQTLRVTLEAGVNRIMLHGSAEGGPNIDWLRLKRN